MSECYGCQGDLLPLTWYERENYGTGPASQHGRWLCYVCERSHAVSRDAAGLEPLSPAERDVLMVGHLILAEMRGLAQDTQPDDGSDSTAGAG